MTEPMLHQCTLRRSNASVSGTLTNRVLKLLILDIVPRRYRCVIYHDVDMKLPCSVRRYKRLLGKEHVFLAHKHPNRETAAQEIQTLLNINLITLQQSQQALQRFKELKFDQAPNSQLTANYILIRRNTQKVRKLCRHWMAEFLTGIHRDQVSLQLVAFVLGVPIKVLAPVKKKNQLVPQKQFR